MNATTADSAWSRPSPLTVRERLHDAMTRCPRLRGSAKLISRAGGTTWKAGEKASQGVNGVSVATLVGLVAQSDEVMEEFLRLAGREDVLTTREEMQERARRAARVLAGDDE